MTPPHRNIQVIYKALDLGMPKHNSMIKYIGHVSLDFSIVPTYLLHSIQQAAVEEFKTRECAVCDQLKNSKNTIAYLKNKVKETEKNAKT